MSRFYKLEVTERIQETPDAISIALNIPEALKNTFSYKQGQYLTFEKEIDGESVRRSYSLCSSPYVDTQPTVCIKKVDSGKMSEFMVNKLQQGDTVNVMPPDGRFYTELNANNKKHYILLGGGSGITPLLGIIKSVLHQEPESQISLIYTNRNANSIIFKSQLDALQKSNSNRFNKLYSIDAPDANWQGVAGWPNSDTIAEWIKNCHTDLKVREYFLCGPEGMMECAKQAFKKIDLPEKNIHIEHFTAPKPVQDTPNIANSDASKNAAYAKVTVLLDNNTYELEVDDDTTILQAGLDAGIDPPFSCEAGICSTCMAKVLEGEVRMDENNILSDEEVENGFVLTCQSHPVTKTVKVEYFD